MILRTLFSSIILLLVFYMGECSKDRVLLSDVTALTLNAKGMTTGRRSPRFPQLKCIGGDAFGQVALPEHVQCYNRGSDGNDVQWECRADLDSRIKFGKISVSCEGYDHPDDRYVLKGSCALEYELEWRHSATGSSSKGVSRPTAGSMVETFMTWASVAFIVAVVFYMFCYNGRDAAGDGTRHGRMGGFGGGGGFDGGPGFPGAPPPPPHRPPPPSYDDATKGGKSTSYGWSAGPSTSAAAPGAGNQSDGPGFWSGAALGALGGFFAGRQGGDMRYRRGPDSFEQNTGFSNSAYAGSSAPSGAGTAPSSGFGGTTRR